MIRQRETPKTEWLPAHHSKTFLTTGPVRHAVSAKNTSRNGEDKNCHDAQLLTSSCASWQQKYEKPSESDTTRNFLAQYALRDHNINLIFHAADRTFEMRSNTAKGIVFIIPTIGVSISSITRPTIYN